MRTENCVQLVFSGDPNSIIIAGVFRVCGKGWKGKVYANDFPATNYEYLAWEVIISWSSKLSFFKDSIPDDLPYQARKSD
jgi:hypothetical protein